MSNKLIAFLSGSSGSGKNTVINNLVGQNETYGFITSYTTRKKRESDIEGKNYFFISKEDFENKIKNGDMLEFDFFSDNYYGIGKESIHKKLEDKDVALKDITVAGVKNSKEKINQYKIISFFLTAQKKELINRLVKRGEKNIKSRMKFYRNEQKRMHESDYVIENVNLEQTLNDLKILIEIELNNKPLLPVVSCQEVLDKKITKYVNQLNKNKSIKPITVFIQGNKAYILDGVNRYLAGLKCGKSVCRIVVNDADIKVSEDFDLKEWNKIVKMYTKEDK